MPQPDQRMAVGPVERRAKRRGCRDDGWARGGPSQGQLRPLHVCRVTPAPLPRSSLRGNAAAAQSFHGRDDVMRRRLSHAPKRPACLGTVELRASRPFSLPVCSESLQPQAADRARKANGAIGPGSALTSWRERVATVPSLDVARRTMLPLIGSSCCEQLRGERGRAQSGTTRRLIECCDAPRHFLRFQPCLACLMSVALKGARFVVRNTLLASSRLGVAAAAAT